MKRFVTRLGLLAGALFLSGAMTWILVGGRPPERGRAAGKAEGWVGLARPALAQVAGATFLESEAGITAYVNLSRTLDLSAVKAKFRTLEKETADYVVGSVALTGYDSTHDIHAFVTRDGWVAGYYNKAEPTSKFVDMGNYASGSSTISNKLALGLAQLGLGAASSSLKYYHFAYSTANRMLTVADASLFYITIPGQFAVSEASVSYASGSSSATIATTLLSPDRRHSVFLSNNYWCIDDVSVAYAYSNYANRPLALVVVYTEP